LLAFITQVAPLLGLLGTVLGMVKMFFSLQQAGMSNVDVSLLSSGIWQALLTTAAGLMVAAPSLAAHSYLSTRLEHFRFHLKDSVERLLTALSETSYDTSNENFLLNQEEFSDQQDTLNNPKRGRDV